MAAPEHPEPSGGSDEVEVVLPRGDSVRRRSLPALLISVADVIAWLAAPPPPAANPSIAAWMAAGRLGLQLIARGRLLPAASAGGWDAWRVGPFDPADLSRLADLAAAGRQVGQSGQIGGVKGPTLQASQPPALAAGSSRPRAISCKPRRPAASQAPSDGLAAEEVERRARR